ncbi:MAG: hypothetical protein HUU41_14710 [Bryobacteraceae bacterium]|nr:hypothetical protein [Bryobacteraceae bacterium]
MSGKQDKPEKKATPPADNPRKRFEQWEELEQDQAQEQALRRLKAIEEEKKKNVK